MLVFYLIGNTRSRISFRVLVLFMIICNTKADNLRAVPKYHLSTLHPHERLKISVSLAFLMDNKNQFPLFLFSLCLFALEADQDKERSITVEYCLASSQTDILRLPSSWTASLWCLDPHWEWTLRPFLKKNILIKKEIVFSWNRKIVELSKCLRQWRGEQTKPSPTLPVSHSNNMSSTHVLELWLKCAAEFYPFMDRVEANKSVF